LVLITASIASACTSSRPLRGWPSESNAPDLISDSMTFLLQTTASTLRRKSEKSVYAPFSRRAATIASTTLTPTLRIPPRPNRMSSPTGAKLRTESLTSGASTVMPMRRHSAR
jgi:hypothetical protein